MHSKSYFGNLKRWEHLENVDRDLKYNIEMLMLSDMRALAEFIWLRTGNELQGFMKYDDFLSV
jgi:hypothetical protein